jgi:hypothetical protein
MDELRSRERPASFLFVVASAVALTGCPKETTVWEADRCRVGAMPEVKLPDGQKPSWTGCRAMYLAEVADIPANFIVQLTTGGARGSFVDPAPGWLTLNLYGIDDADDHYTLRSGMLSSAGDAGLYYAGAAEKDVRFDAGAVSVSNMDLGAHGDAASDTFTFDATITGAGKDSYAQGSLSVYAPEPEDTTSAPTGAASTSGSCSASACDGYDSQCNGTSQAPCYCAAACHCRCAGNESCAQSNAASAASLGTTCSLPPK